MMLKQLQRLGRRSPVTAAEPTHRPADDVRAATGRETRSRDSEDSRQPLAGVRVIEFGTLLAGPFSTRFLADFGAEVIKVEDPKAGDPMRDWGPVKYRGRGLVWPTQSRNKKSVTIDLRAPEGQELARRLVARADLVVENFRPGTMERWGLGYDDLRMINPRIVMVRVSGYGQTGPYRNRTGFGAAAGAMGGLRYLTGYPDRPPVRVGLSIEDSLGSLQAVIGALLALYRRDARGGDGQVVDVSITEAVLALTEGAVTEYSATGYIREREGSTLPGVAPSNIYEAKDGRWHVIAANGDNPFRRLFELMGHPEIAADPKLHSHEGRYQARELLDRLIAEWAAKHDSNEIIQKLEEAGVPSAPIYSSADIAQDPHFRERETIIEVDDPELGRLTMPGVMPKLLGTPGRVRWTGPRLGEHNDEVFRSLIGLTDDELARLKESGTI